LSAALTRELEDVVAALDTRVPRTAGDPKQTWGR
jgi:hypothetical protein